jgi:HAD superfamily hydrolase (TIGR02253 family)
MIKAIIFDLDNTLIDFMKMKKMSIEAAASAMIDAGLNIEKEKIMDKLFHLYDQYGWEEQNIFQKYLTEEAGEVDHRVLAYAINAYRRVRSGFLEPFPHVMSTLIELKKRGVKLSIVSDAPRLKAWIRLTAMKIDHFFDFVVAFEDTKELKPSKKPFEVALHKLNLKPEECLMIGDMPERDIKGAKSLGIKTGLASYGGKKCDASIKSDYILEDINDLLDIIK